VRSSASRIHRILEPPANARPIPFCSRPGQQKPIVDRALFSAVQTKLAQQLNNHTATRAKSDALLMGHIFDDRGNLMSPSHARKHGVKYRYYISRPLLEGRANLAGSVNRVPAVKIENAVHKAVRWKIDPSSTAESPTLIRLHVARVVVKSDHLVIELKSRNEDRNGERTSRRKTIRIPWLKPPSKRRRELLVPESQTRTDKRPIRADARGRLVAAISQGRNWLNELVTGAAADIEAIAARERCSSRRVNMTISLAFLAPNLVKAAIEGRLPRGIGITRLCDPPAEWSQQHRKLGLKSS
jgi:site-specific DNA recombinase